VILPLLGVFEKPLPIPATIEDDFKAHVAKHAGGARSVADPTPAE
jgi:ubiquinol-cytochrome c reductase cytochrome b subunit